MLLTYAISNGDHEACLRLAKFMRFVPNQGAHDLLLATTEELVPVRNEIEELVGPLFARVYTLTIPKIRTGWPGGPNSYFHAVAKYILANIPCDAWYFFEAGDCVPLRPGWLDELEADYKRGMRPVMGLVHPTLFWNRGDEGHLNKNGDHIVGTAVYPRDLPRRIPIFDNLAVATIPFDVFFQWYLVPIAYNTRLIGHAWQTCNYKTQKDGSVIGEAVPGSRRPDAMAVQAVDWSVAVHHGCKDDSLLHIVRGKLSAKGIKPVKLEKKVVIAAPAAAPIVDPLGPAPFPGAKSGGWR